MKISKETLFNRRLSTIFLLGFASGLPLHLTHSALQAWFQQAGIDIVAIGALSLVGIPYTLKFLWAPALDRYTLPWLGRRRGWMLLAQLGLIASVAAMAFGDPSSNVWYLVKLAVLIAFLSATQDIAIDAYRADILLPHERGLGAALAVGGYRLAMYVLAGVAFMVANFYGWQKTYLLMAAFMLIGCFATFIGPEPEQVSHIPHTLAAAVVEPMKEFFSRTSAWPFLLLIVLYKLGDVFAFSLIAPFLLDLNFSLLDVGAMTKGVGLTGTLLGVFCGGLVMTQFGLYRSLFFFGILQAVSNLSFMLLAMAGKNYTLALAAIFLENICGGMGTSAFVAFLMSLCDKRYTATQFALLSALASVGRELVGPAAGLMVKNMGWTNFYFTTVIFALPGLVVLYMLRRQIQVKDFLLAET